ncbi:hypothetical protein ACNF49_04860 [Actinomadura sp. ATCC 39365]
MRSSADLWAPRGRGSAARGGGSSSSGAGRQVIGSAPSSLSSGTCSLHHGEIASRPLRTPSANSFHGIQRTSPTSSGLGATGASTVTR